MSNLKRVFAGYCSANSLCNVTPEQAKKLTHLNVAFATVDETRLTVEPIRRHLYYLGQLRRYNPELNICISTGGGGGKGHGYATKPEHLDEFVQSTMAIIREFDFDGLDCDWEFPCDTGEKAEIAQHRELIAAYRRELDAYAAQRGRKCWLTIAAGCRVVNCESTDIPAMAQYLDFMNLMTYDWRYRGPVTGHHSCPRGPQSEYPYSVEMSIDLFHKAGFPKERMVVGCAFYSHRFDGVVGGGTGLGQPYTGICDYGPSYHAIHYIYEKSSDFIKYWDDEAKAPYLFNGESFITYDDPQSIAYKAKIVKDGGLLGLMYWVQGSDETGILFNAAYDSLLG